MPAVGGVARRANWIKGERERNPHVLVLDAGDSLVGDRDPARKTQGQTSVEAMNQMGYDAMALGPLDLALGPKVLAERIAEAKFAILSANAVASSTGELVATPYVVREMSGQRVAIVGLSGSGDTDEIDVRDPLATASEVVAEVAGQADIVILLSHAGQEVDQRIADTVPGIAFIVSGGQGASESAWQSQATGVPVFHADQASAGHAGRILGVGTLSFDVNARLESYNWRRVPLGPDVPDDPSMAAWVQQQRAR